MSSEYQTASELGGQEEPRRRPTSDIIIDTSVTSTDTSTRPGSAGDNPPSTAASKRGRVRFNSTSESNDAPNRRASIPLRDRTLSPTALRTPKTILASPSHSRNNSVTNLLRYSPERENEDPFADTATISPLLKPRPGVLRNSSFSRDQGDVEENDHEKTFSALAAQERAQRVATLVGSHSAPTSARTSFEDDDDARPIPRPTGASQFPVRIDDIPLVDIAAARTFDGAGGDGEEFHDEKGRPEAQVSTSTEAHQLVRQHTTRKLGSSGQRRTSDSGPAPGAVSGQVTPTEEQAYDEYVARPAQYRGGVLSSLLKLYNPAPGSGSQGQSRRGSAEFSTSPGLTGATLSPAASGATTPKTKAAKWYHQRNQSQDTLAGLIEASAILAGPAGGGKGPIRPGMGKRTQSGRLIESTIGRISGRPRLEDEIRITVHIAETLSRQKYLLKLCRALMQYGAPTHRLEEYMKMSARVLEIEGQFLYMPGCMIISFDDASTHTTEVKLVRSVQGVDLGRLQDVHEIYKEVVHDVVGVEEATQRLVNITKAKPRNPAWVCVLVYGLASASVAPFAFQARLIDLPIAFILGCILGFLQLIVAPRSELYSNVFEISAAVCTSFLARMFGSLKGGNLFCFSALAQSSIALILPGYMVLCGSLELQSRSMVAGSVRMVYAIMYSLFLGFGITIGTALYGLFDSNATSATTCANPISDYEKWVFVPVFALCLTVVNQAKWKQTPVMLFIAFAGYIVNFYSAKRFKSNAQISNALGALAIGVMGNLYSRMRHGVAAAALLPAIFVQVPSGLAASGSLLAGLSSADLITNTSTYSNGTSKINGTSTVGLPNLSSGGDGHGHPTNFTVTPDSKHPLMIPFAVWASDRIGLFGNWVSLEAGQDLNNIVFNVGYSMIQVAIGITVGLFLSALIVYPLGKRRSGLFSF